MIRGFVLTIGLLAAFAPAMAHAQTNLDQGKSASQIFAAACAECHKAPRALAAGKNSSTLTEFLREHYTTSRDQAAALAAYVLGGRDTIAAPAPGKKPPGERAKAQKPAKPEEGASANAKPHRPTEAEAKPKEEVSPGEIPSLVNPIIRPEQRSAARNRHKDPKTGEPPQEPAAAVVEPARSETPPSQEAAPTPTAAVPTDAAPGETAPVPRDNVPD